MVHKSYVIWQRNLPGRGAGASSSLWLVAVGMLWGCTNPLIKLGSKGVTDLPKRSHPVLQFLSETFFLFTRWQVGGDFNSRLTIRDLRLRLVRCAVPGSI